MATELRPLVVINKKKEIKKRLVHSEILAYGGKFFTARSVGSYPGEPMNE